MLREINAANIVEYYKEVNDDTVADYLGQVLFPARKQIGLDLSWIKGASSAPVALKPSAFDVDVTLRDRIGVETLETEMPFFKEALLLKEKERQELLNLSQMNNPTLYQTYLQRIFNDRARLVDGAEAQAERMRMQLITQGKIAIKDNKVELDYDYGFDFENNMITITGEEAWDKDKADPLADIEEAISRAVDKPELIVMNTKTFGLLKKHKSLKEYLGKEVVITNQVLKDYLQTEFGLTVVLYDKQYKTEVFGQSTKYVPDGVVSLVPREIGNTYYGTTPEEADLMAGIGTSAQVEVVNTGVAVTTKTKDDPVNVITKVSEIVLPSAEMLDSVFILNVTEEAEPEAPTEPEETE